MALALVLVAYLQLFRPVRSEMREVSGNVHVRLERPVLDRLGSPVAQEENLGAPNIGDSTIAAETIAFVDALEAAARV